MPDGELDEEPLLSETLLKLTRWMADYYLCGWGQVLQAIVPAGARDQSGTRETVMVCGDAKSVIDQMEGKAAVVAVSIKPLHRKAHKLAHQFRNLYWEWTPRRYNHTADALTRRALRQIRAYPDQWYNFYDYWGGGKEG